MDFRKKPKTPSGRPSIFPHEIHSRIRNGFLVRLDEKKRRLRRLAAERKWTEIQREFRQIRRAAEGSGDTRLFELADEALQRFSDHNRGRTRIVNQNIHQAVQGVFTEIDNILSSNSINKDL